MSIESLSDYNLKSGLHEHFNFLVDSKQVSMRIDKFLSNQISNLTRNKVQKLFDQNLVLVNNNPVKSSYKIKPYDNIILYKLFPKRIETLTPEKIKLDILHEDTDIIIVNKPSGMVVHPSFGHFTGTLMNGIKYHFENLPNQDNELRPGLVHRIDKNTSGILVIAKNDNSLVHLQKQFFERTSRRKYIALVWGDFNENSGTISGNIGRSLKNRKIFQVFPDDKNYGKKAVTHFKVLERFNYVTLIECKLETGRTHQIRVHFNHIGHPLFNDDIYGGDKLLKGTTFSKYKQFVQNCFKVINRQALHAKSLGFIHPRTNKWIEFESELPLDFSLAIQKWRKYSKFNIK